MSFRSARSSTHDLTSLLHEWKIGLVGAQLRGGALHSASEEIFNRILLALPHAVRDEVLQQCDRIEIASGQLIYGYGAEVEYAYFINTGLVSLIKRMEDGRSVEIAAIGIEGLLGLFAAHGFDRALLDHIVQVPVLALRITRRALQNSISKHETLRLVMTRYLVLVAEQLAQVSACNRLHSLEQRCSSLVTTPYRINFSSLMNS